MIDEESTNQLDSAGRCYWASQFSMVASSRFPGNTNSCPRRGIKQRWRQSKPAQISSVYAALAFLISVIIFPRIVLFTSANSDTCWSSR